MRGARHASEEIDEIARNFFERDWQMLAEFMEVWDPGISTGGNKIYIAETRKQNRMIEDALGGRTMQKIERQIKQARVARSAGMFGNMPKRRTAGRCSARRDGAFGYAANGYVLPAPETSRKTAL